GLGLTIAKMLTDLMGGELTVASTPDVGSVFRVKLFLPEVRLAPGAALPVPSSRAHKARYGYAGARRRVLVVDNEEADRELLVNVLEPLGFELRTAASGHDCLDLLAAGYRPEVILMDLAMPGIDGWETLRRVRALEQAEQGPAAGPSQGGGAPPGGSALHEVKSVGAHMAIVSANAFDKGLDNDVGVRLEDFILKPVRHSELLDWLERRLQLVWLEAPAQAPAVAASAAPPRIYPPAAQLAALREVVNLGYFRGIMNTLDEIEKSQPQSAGFAAEMRGLARQFQFETMSQQLGEAPT
ncbi:MAG: ATP-binding response regulator, partial [Polaromonas sp.]|uniref:ATP-binding response regulator n=1 Tax=Polaromonas sp. TaxID=1869339 RepID=UPI004036F020